MVGIIVAEIGVLSSLCFHMILRYAPDHRLVIDDGVRRGILLYSIAVGSYIGLFFTRWEWYGQLACGLLAVYLLVASVQDLQTCLVYDFLHIPAALSGICFILMDPAWDKIISLFLFAAIQLGIFMRMYGAADGMVFLVCAVFESRFGNGLLTYLLHMGAAYVILAIVQGFRRNINKRGNLKKPVPFVPYIAATVWPFL